VVRDPHPSLTLFIPARFIPIDVGTEARLKLRQNENKNSRPRERAVVGGECSGMGNNFLS
jgi:hypothetical protein